MRKKPAVLVWFLVAISRKISYYIPFLFTGEIQKFVVELLRRVRYDGAHDSELSFKVSKGIPEIGIVSKDFSPGH